MADNAFVKPAAGRGDYVQPVPAWRVTLAGQDLTEVMRPRLIEISLSEKRGEEADQLDITLHDADGRLALPPPDAIISVALGWARGTGVTSGLVEKGAFKVDEVTWAGAPDTVRITARSADMTTGMRRRRDRSWNNQTIGQIVRTIASEHGQTARVHASLADITVESIQQSAKSNLQFIRDLGRRYDAVATVKDGNLIFAPIGTGTSVSGTPLPGRTITRIGSSNYSYTRKKREEHDGAEAQYNDRSGARRERVRVGSGDNPRRLRRTYSNEVDARAAAEAAARRDARQAADFNLTLAYGDPTIFPERPVRLSGFKSEVDAAPWQVAEVTHSMGPQGYKTDIKLDLGAEEADAPSR
ncbi:MAG: contractile injection system protein, VgrG/Pvc8 family [Pseudomonadota bacterium]